VPDQEFVFSLELSGEAGFEDMVNDIARTVLGSAGFAGDPAPLSGAIGQALAAAGARVPCVLSFHAHDGTLRIAVTCDGHARWQTAVDLPPS
jgi:hypothetical protein